jgi:hypothetical protein
MLEYGKNLHCIARQAQNSLDIDKEIVSLQAIVRFFSFHDPFNFFIIVIVVFHGLCQ